MALPDDPATLRRWRTFVVKRWIDDINPWFSCVHAVMLGMLISRRDFMDIVRQYVDGETENKTYGRRHDRQS